MVQRSLVGLILLFVLLLSGCGVAPPQNGWSGASVAGNDLYVGSPTGEVLKLAAGDGSKVWQFPSEANKNIGRIYANPVLSNDTVYIAGSDKFVYALNASNGAQRWNWNIGDDAVIAPAQVSADGKTVYWATSAGHVFAQNAQSGGEPIWNFRAVQGIWGQPVLDAKRGQLLVASLDRHLYTLDANTGKLRWDKVLGGALPAAPTLSGDTIYINAFDRKLHALSADTGDELWSVDLQNWSFSSPVVNGDTLYLGAVDHQVYAISLGSHTIQWHQGLGGRIVGGVTLSQDGKTLYVGSEDQKLNALDAGSGKILWTSDLLTGKIFMTPAVSNNLVYVATLDQNLYAYNATTGQRQWAKALTQSGTGAEPKPGGF